MEKEKEPWISIEGVLLDVQAGQLKVGEALEEIMSYFIKADTKSDTPTITSPH